VSQAVGERARTGSSAETLGALWRRAVEARAPQPPFLEKRGDAWHPIGWDEAADRVDALANGFLSLGVTKGDRVAILARTRLEWSLSDYALSTIGAVVIPIYPTSSPSEVAYVLSDSATKVLLCEDAEQLAKLDGLDLPALERVIGIDVKAPGGTLADVVEAGRTFAREHPDALATAAGQVGPADELTFLYTSGTTGPPKGCVLTQRNYVSMVESVVAVENLFRDDDTILLFLPLAHNFARLIEFVAAAKGSTLAFCPDVRDVTNALSEVRPTLFPSVPRVYEKVHGAVLGAVAETSGVKRRLGEWGFAVGERAAASKGKAGPLLALQARIADRLVLSKVRARMGGRLRYAVSGGAPLAREIAEFFAGCGIFILEGYGMTECTTAATINPPADFRFGTVGRALPGIELRIDSDGEVLIKGPNVFSGYYGNPEATAEILTEDGWLRSGDIGAIDDDGYLTITDRKKDIIVTAGGKNISPQLIENALKASPYVSQALVIGDNKPYLVALITVDQAAVEPLGGPDSPEVREAVERGVADVNSDLGRVEQIKRFAILPRDFSEEEGEVTATLKLKRRKCAEHFSEDIDRLYAAPRE
jgi:long-chain acyl-CoA synthetase